jgi:hypothetical protein
VIISNLLVVVIVSWLLILLQFVNWLLIFFIPIRLGFVKFEQFLSLSRCSLDRILYLLLAT